MKTVFVLGEFQSTPFAAFSVEKDALDERERLMKEAKGKREVVVTEVNLFHGPPSHAR